MARKPTPEDGTPISPFVSVAEYLHVQEAMAEATCATTYLLHPEDAEAGEKLMLEIVDLADEQRKRVNGNRHGESLITVADLRLMTAGWLRVLLEKLEGVEQ